MKQTSYHRHYEEEQELGKVFDRQLFRRLMGYLRPHAGMLIFAVITLGLGKVCMVLLPLELNGMLKSVEDGLGREVFKNHFYNGLLLLFGFAVLSWAGAQPAALTGLRVVDKMRRELFAHLIKMPMSFFDRTSVGRLLSRCVNDVDALAEMFGMSVVNLFGDSIILVGTISAMFFMDPWLASFSLLVLPFMIWHTGWFRVRARKGYRKVRAVLSALNGFTQENFSGMTTVQAFAREKRQAEVYHELSDDHATANVETIHAFSIFFAGIDVLANGMLVAFIVGMALVVRPGETFPVSHFVTFSVMVNMLFRPLRSLSDSYNRIQAAMAASDRIFVLLDTPIRLLSPASPKPFSETIDRVDFENVWFSYDAACVDKEPDNPSWILRDVSFTLKSGEKVALVGATGSGKTTVMNLLCRFYDIQKGRILVNGTDIREYELEELRSRIGVVQQDPFIFTGTIRENITLGADMPEETVREAAKFVNAERFIDKLPKGFDEMMLEQGAGLSVGERQLLAFARAIAWNPELLMMDEVTSHIDTFTEKLIQEAIGRMLSKKTSLIIAHRLSTIRQVDTVLVMHAGKLVEKGNHSELMEKGGLYKKLYDIQFGYQEDSAE